MNTTNIIIFLILNNSYYKLYIPFFLIIKYKCYKYKCYKYIVEYDASVTSLQYAANFLHLPQCLVFLNNNLFNMMKIILMQNPIKLGHHEKKSINLSLKYAIKAMLQLPAEI